MRTIPWRLWCLAAFSALLQLLPFPIAGPVPSWRRYFCWICLVPLLTAVLSNDSRGRPLRWQQAALLGYVCGFLWFIGNCYWIYQTMHIYGNIPAVGSLGILVLFSLYLGLYQACFAGLLAAMRGKYSPAVALFISPFLWVGIELARARVTGFPWDLLGYTQVDNLLLTKLAPFGGVMLLSFVIATVSAFFVAAWLVAGRRHRWGFLLAALVVAVLLQAGALYRPSYDNADHTAVLLQENLAVGAEGREVNPLTAAQKYREFSDWSLQPRLPANKEFNQIIQAPFSNEIDRLEATKPSLIVWPEAPADFVTSDPLFRGELGNLARTANAPVIAGSVGIDFDPSAERGYREFGSAAVFSATGNYLGRYDKIHRVPWGEYVPYKQLFFFADKLVSGVGNMDPGTKYAVFQLNGHSVGIFICYESIFGDEVRQFVKNGADVLVNISDDGWYGDTGAPWQHLDMERMRAIENHRWILRDTNTGVTTSIDPEGRGIFTTPRHVRAAFAFPFAYQSDMSFYTRHGDWFAWLCAIVSVAALVFGYFRPRRRIAEVH